MSPAGASASSLRGQQTPPTTIPQLTSLDDLIVISSLDPIANEEKTTFLLITDGDEIYFSRASKTQADMTLNDYNKAPGRILDDQLFPEVPKNTPLTIATDGPDDNMI
jgi:hypothetical protein